MYKVVLVVHSSMWDTIAAKTTNDLQLQQIIHALQQGSNSYLGYTLQKGHLFYQDRAVIPKDSSQIPLLLVEFHD